MKFIEVEVSGNKVVVDYELELTSDWYARNDSAEVGYVLNKVWREGVDITQRIQRFCPKLWKQFEIIAEEQEVEI